MPVDIFHDPILRQKPHGSESPEASNDTSSTTSPLDFRILHSQLQDLDLADILRDALCDFNVRKKLGQDAGSLDVAGGRTSLLPDWNGKSAAVFNDSSLDKKIRLILNDLLRVYHLATIAPQFVKSSKWEWRTYSSEIFSSSSCVVDVSEILSFMADGLEDLLSFNAICHCVIRMPHGLWMMGRLLSHSHWRVSEVCQFLMEQCSGDDIEDAASIFYGKVLLYLSYVFPASALHIRHLAISQQRFFSLILSVTLQWHKKLQTPPEMTVELDEAVVNLLCQLLVSPKEDFRAWSAENCRLAGTLGLASFEECRLQLLIHAYKNLPDSSVELAENQLVSVMRILRLYIHLKESAELILTTEEYRILSKLATCRSTTLSVLTNQFIILGLCCFTLLPDSFVDGSVEGDFVEWIKWQLGVDVVALDEMVPDGGTHLEVLLLMASHLRAAHYKSIAEMLSDCLGFKVLVKSNSIIRMKNLLNNEVFREEALLRHTLRVPPTQNLNAAFASALPVNCVYSLLQNKMHTSYDGLIKDWILAQIRKCSVPVHPVIVQVLALYVERTLPFLRKNQEGLEEYVSLQKPFRSTEICSVIYDIPEPTKTAMKNLRTADLFNHRDTASTSGQVHVSKILMAFYVLAYNSYYMNHLKTYMVAQLSYLQPYGMDLIEKIPFKYYLALTVRYQDLYDPLGDILGRLMLEVLPQMRTVHDDMESSFFEKENSDPDSDLRSPVLSLPAEGSSASEALTSRYLDLLSRSPVDHLSTCMDDFLSLLPRMWTEILPPSTRDTFEKVWSRLAALDSNTVFLATIRAFLLLKDKGMVLVTFEDLCFEPLHILRCDSALFEKGFLTRILLRIFTSYMTASKLYLSNQLEIVEQDLMIKRYVDSLDPVREEQKRAMFMLQESVAVQILIEQCVMTNATSHAFGLPSDLTESQSAICTFIHRLILANPTLAKLVIFQGFPLAAVACIVRGVESLHICFDYLHEAMALPSIEKKLFVLELTSCLCVKFRIARTLVVARLAVDVIGTILISYPLNARHQIMSVGSRCLARIGNVFPPLREDCLAILDQMRAMDRSGQRTSRQWKCTAGHLLGGTSLTSNPVALSSLLDSAVASVSGHPALLSQND